MKTNILNTFYTIFASIKRYNHKFLSLRIKACSKHDFLTFEHFKRLLNTDCLNNLSIVLLTVSICYDNQYPLYIISFDLDILNTFYTIFASIKRCNDKFLFFLVLNMRIRICLKK